MNTRALALASTLASTVSSGACAKGDTTPEGGPGLGITVAPLQLDGVGGASYRVEVFAGDPAAGAPLVVDLDELTSSRYGDGKGSLSYVAPCDASVEYNFVRLTLKELRTQGGALIDADTWRNPTPLVRSARCEENKDTLVEFNLTILRDAQQGFFDVAVNFSDIFCSAKFDCRDKDGLPIELLHNGQDRDTTLVLAFACTSGAEEATFLHMSDVYVECVDGATVTPHWISPAPKEQLGNQGPVDSLFFQTAIYAGDEQLAPYDKCYWNLAFGLSPDAPGNCTLKADATASPTSWTAQDGRSPANTIYPYVHFEIPITDGEGNLAQSCGRHAVGDASLRVTTAYTDFVGTAFPHERQCGTDDPPPPWRVACVGDVQGVGDTTATFTDTPSGVSVAFGDIKSRQYALPADLQIGSCCLNPCCTQ